MDNDAALKPTPNLCALPRRFSDFATFGEALDYAAGGVRGLNFHDPRGNLTRVYPFAELREDALAMARRLIAAGAKPGDRIALVAQTGPEFAALFCGTIYAGAWPVPLPLPTSFGGKESYIEQLAVQLESSDPAMLLYPEEIAEMAHAAAERQGCDGASFEEFAGRPAMGRFRRRIPTTSATCSIRAARPASHTASPSPTARCSTTCAGTASA